MKGKPELTDAEAVYYLLLWKSGQFVFKPEEITSENRLNTSITNLLLEGARRMDEASM